jgi:hypothetical protein
VAGFVLGLTKHPLAGGTGALGGLLSTAWPWVAVSSFVSLVVGSGLGVISRALALAPAKLGGASSSAAIRPSVTG